MVIRVCALIYGVTVYVLFVLTCLYCICFVGNVIVPKTIDSGPVISFSKSLVINIILLVLWGTQHSLMARQWFKDWWTKFIKPPIERSTYVLIATLLLILLFYRWRPMPQVVWNMENPLGALALSSLYYIGWLSMFYSTFLIDHFDLFGLRQVYLYFRGKEYTPIIFKTPALHKVVRHPIMFSLFVVFWATPMMTIGRLVFAVVLTIYTITGTLLEERDLIKMYGETYLSYKQKISMFFPIPKRNS